MQQTNNILITQSDPPLCSAPTTSGPGWASASLQTYSSCHWAPTDFLSCIKDKGGGRDEGDEQGPDINKQFMESDI